MLEVFNSNVTMNIVHYFLSQNIGVKKDIVCPLVQKLGGQDHPEKQSLYLIVATRFDTMSHQERTGFNGGVNSFQIERVCAQRKNCTTMKFVQLPMIEIRNAFYTLPSGFSNFIQ